MSDRYVAKVVKVIDQYTVVLNIGAEKDVRVGKTFLIVGLGETIVDPDTSEPLEQLEIVRGRARVTHVQSKISTLTSADVEKTPDIREVKKVSAGRGNAITALLGPQETVTESIKPSEPRIKAFAKVQVGDLAIEA